MANYAFKDFPMPIDGNIGVRVVQTDNTAHGHLIVNGQQVTNGDNVSANYSEDFDAKNDYTHVLPSFNLRLKAKDNLFIRFAASKAIWAPSFADMQALITINPTIKEASKNKA